MTRPSSSRLKVKVRLSARVAAASWVDPRRPIRSTSVAWINCWVRLARISGQASPSIARSSAAQSAAPLRWAKLWPPNPCVRAVAAWHPVEKVWPAAPSSASDGEQSFEVPSHEVRSRNLEAAGRDQGRDGPDPDAAVLRLALRRAQRAARPGPRWRAGPQPQRHRGRAAGQGRILRPRRGQPGRASTACANWSRRSTPPGTTAGSRRSRSTSTASRAAARPR